MESLPNLSNRTEGDITKLDASPEKSSPCGPSSILSKNHRNAEKKLNPDRRHYRSSSLENNIFISNLSPFASHIDPQQSQNGHSESGASTPANNVHLTSNAASPIGPIRAQKINPNNGNPLMAMSKNQSPASRRRYQPLAPSPHYSALSHHQPMSLGQLTTPSTPINNGDMHGHLKSTASSFATLGGHQTYYGTLKSKREQRRMQMNGQRTGMGAVVGVGQHHHHHLHSNGIAGGGGGGLQARISSVDDLRPGYSNSITKSQVRLMRDMFEQHQLNNGNPGTNNKNNKKSEEAESSKTTGANDQVPLNKPPVIQPCSGVLEMAQPQLIKPIAFKPIPFPADSRFNNGPGNNGENNYDTTNDRYGSTPSLSLPINYNLKFGSTHDLRQPPSQHPSHNQFNTIGSRKGYAYSNMYTNNNYDSMESICSSQSTLKSMSQYNSDLLDTPSPSGSRDSELAYLRHTMEHNEKVIFRVHQDKERNWEEENKRMRTIHAQRIQKFEQIAMMQSFQLRQAKKRHQEEVTSLQERTKDLERKVELQHNELMGHKANEKELRDQYSDIMEENDLLRKLVNELRNRLEESEWTNCQKNGETALLKTQLKDAQSEIIAKDQEITQLRKTDVMKHPFNGHSSLPSKEVQMITTTNSTLPAQPVSINHSDDEKLKDDLQFSHLNRIIILKDQIIMAMTNEIQRLRNQVSDIGLVNSYDGLPPGRVSLNGRANAVGPTGTIMSTNNEQSNNNNEKMCCKDTTILDDYSDLLNNLKNSEELVPGGHWKPTLEELKNALLNNQFGNATQNGSIREKIAINHLSTALVEGANKSGESKRTNLDKGSGEDEVAKLKSELVEIKRGFDSERKKWTEEKEKVLVYQRELQSNYLQMCKRNENLEQILQQNSFNEVAI